MCSTHSMIEAFEKLVGGDALTQSINVSAPAPETASAPNQSGTVDVGAMKEDPKFSKYFKMISVGVPKPSVYAKMTADGSSPTSLDRFKYVHLFLSCLM